MRQLLLLGFCLLSYWATAQTPPSDTVIVQVPDQMARFPGCEELEGGIGKKLECSNRNMLGFVYSNIQYPQEAIQANIEGQVVLRFVVEKDGKIGKVEVVKDIGGGCGAEAARVVKLMNQLPQPWTPAQQQGNIVRSYVSLPVKFKLEEYTPPEFELIGRDTLWLKMDTVATFEGGEEALAKYVEDNLKYPEGQDSCIVGEVEIQTVITEDGRVVILDLLDYTRLNMDFLYEAVDLVHSTKGQWTPAQYKGRSVNTARTFRLRFLPDAIPTCRQVADDYEKAQNLSLEAIQLFDGGQPEEAIAKWTEAIALFPGQAEFLAYRGQAYLDQNLLTEACADLSKARDIMLVAWYNDLLQLICK
ncbi:MAG: TonB family protein [Bacteroidota bacterium]